MAHNLNIPLQGMMNASSDSNGSSRVLSFLESEKHDSLKLVTINNAKMQK